MSTIKDYYAELLSLTQLFILREHSLKDVKVTDSTIIEFFQKGKKHLPRSTPNQSLLASVPLPQAPVAKAPPRATILLPSPDPLPINLETVVQDDPQPLPPPTQPEPLPPQPLPPPTQPEPMTPLPQAPVIQDKASKSKGFSLEPLASVAARDHSEWWNLCQTLFPESNLNKTIPSDAFAQKNKNAWVRNQEVAPVLILSFHDNEQQPLFLKNIAQAISLRLAPAQVLSVSRIDKDNRWENILNFSHLRLVIAGDYELYMHPKLMHYYREVSQQGKHFLHHTPLLLLSDLSLYLKEPQLKSLLWRAICNEFAATHSKL